LRERFEEVPEDLDAGPEPQSPKKAHSTKHKVRSKALKVLGIAKGHKEHNSEGPEIDHGKEFWTRKEFTVEFDKQCTCGYFTCKSCPRFVFVADGEWVTQVSDFASDEGVDPAPLAATPGYIWVPR
jgi:hypothetical protein